MEQEFFNTQNRIQGAKDLKTMSLFGVNDNGSVMR